MKIYCCMITLNEEHNIGRAVRSLAGVVDGVLIVDGGSHDDTILQAQLAGADAALPVSIYIHAWEHHFAQQRQQTLVQLPQEWDSWWVRLDADEALSVSLRQSLSPAIEEADRQGLNALRIMQTNFVDDTDHYAADLGGWETHPRAFRHHPDLVWFGQVHEYIIRMTSSGKRSITEEEIGNLSADVWHFGWLDKERREARERLYARMPGSGFYRPGSLVNRPMKVRRYPVAVDVEI